MQQATENAVDHASDNESESMTIIPVEFAEDLSNALLEAHLSDEQMFRLSVTMGNLYPRIGVNLLQSLSEDCEKYGGIKLGFELLLEESGTSFRLFAPLVKENPSWLEDSQLMFFAILKHDRSVVSYLFEKHAAIPDFGELPLDFTPDSIEELELLEKIGFKFDRSKILLRAALQDNLELAEYLRDKGAPVPSQKDLPKNYFPHSRAGINFFKSIGIEIKCNFCKYTFLRGGHKGQQCGEPCAIGEMFCEICSKKKTAQASSLPAPFINIALYEHRKDTYIGKSSSVSNVLFVIESSSKLRATGVDEKNDGNVRDLTEAEKESLKKLGVDV